MSRLDCPKQARCPGCPLGSEPYAAGLAWKGRALAQALAGYSELVPRLREPRAASPLLQYRLRAKLVVAGRALGLYERGSHRVIDIEGCRVLAPSLAATCAALRRALPLPIYGADLRETTEGVMVTLLTETPGERARLETAARGLMEQGAALSVAVATRPRGSVRLLAGAPEVVAGPSAARYRGGEAAPYGYAAHGSFVQAHAGQAAYVHAEIVAGLRQRLAERLAGLSVLELFAGSGSLALLLARAGARVTAVEAYAPAIALAERAAREQGIELDAVASDASLFAERARPRAYDAVIVNPPRRGLTPALRRALARVAPRALAYVSCNPGTLARDLWHLRALGLAPESAEPLDMIPWSDAVEVLTWLSPAPAPAPRALYEDERWLAIDKPPHEPVALEDAPGSGLLGRVRGRAGCAAAVALDSWAADVSGVCWFAKAPRDEADLRRALQGAERELSVLARGTLRKQGTVTRRDAATTARGSRYKKRATVGRHTLASVLCNDENETGVLRDFAGIGHPVAGDALHGDADTNRHLEHRHGLDRVFLHCAAVRLRSASGAELEVESELAPDLRAVLSSLERA